MDPSVLELSFEMGKALLENGAEISRVQETMERVAKALHAEEFSVYVLSNAIFASGREGGVEKRTELSHVPNTTIHFGRICAVNQLSREIAAGRCGLEEACERIEKIRRIPRSCFPAMLLACAVGSAAFSYLFGGSWRDALAAFICGLALEPYLYLADRHRLSKFLTNLSASALVTAIALLLTELVPVGHDLDKVIIGSIIRLVPGVALTTSIRDFFNGDYLSGTIRMIDAILVGGCIAVGVGVVLRVFSPIFGMGGAPL